MKRATPNRRWHPARAEKLLRWEQAVKSKVVSFAVEDLSGSLHVARWLPAPYSKGRKSFPYHLAR